jgi:imidazolonepropionase-like amidohydrolase
VTRLILACAAFTFALPGAAQQPRSLAIANATLIDGTGTALVRGVTVVIEGSRIREVRGPGEAPPRTDETVDATGKFLIPGLWDMHTHLTYAGDVTASLLVAHGVTAVRDLGGSLDAIDWLRGRIESGELPGPRIFRAGPLVDGSKPGVRDRVVVATADHGRAAAAFLAGRGVDVIKVHNGTPPAAYFALLGEARRRGLAVAGHIPYDVDPADAIAGGHQSVEHVVSLLEGPVRRKVAGGMPQEQAIAEFTDAEATRLARLMAARGTWFDPTLVTYWYRAHQWEVRASNDPREKLVTATLRAYWQTMPPPKDTPETRRALADGFERFLSIARTMHREGVRFLVGTDLAMPLTYPGSTVHEEMGWLVRAGLTPMEAIVAATRHGAEAMGRADLGTILPGKLADLVLLDADPLRDIANTQKIAAVVTNGRFLSRGALDALLDDVARQAPER